MPPCSGSAQGSTPTQGSPTSLTPTPAPSAAESPLCLSPTDTHTNPGTPWVGDRPDTVKIARQLLSVPWAGRLQGHGTG